METSQALITNNAVILGVLATILGFVFYTSNLKRGFWGKFYSYVPALLMCYFLPSLLNTFGIIDGSNNDVYTVAKYYLLPACLVLLTLSIDIKSVMGLGKKAIIMFFTGTIGVVIGDRLRF